MAAKRPRRVGEQISNFPEIKTELYVEICVVFPYNLYYSDPGHASYHVR